MMIKSLRKSLDYIVQTVVFGKMSHLGSGYYYFGMRVFEGALGLVSYMYIMIY